ASVRHRAPRRAGQATPANRKRFLPGGGRRARRLLGPEPVFPSLQARRRRHAGAVPDLRKNRLIRTSPVKKRRSDPLPFPMSSVGRRTLAGRSSPPANRITIPESTSKGETMTQRETPQVIGVRHVGLSARDPAALAEFYRDVLGLQV